MKAIEIDQFTANASQFLNDSQNEKIVLTVDGKPKAIMYGVDYDEEQQALINSPEFWKLIEERRNSPVVPWTEAKARLNKLDTGERSQEK